jgi:hypothetical protein
MISDDAGTKESVWAYLETGTGIASLRRTVLTVQVMKRLSIFNFKTRNHGEYEMAESVVQVS